MRRFLFLLDFLLSWFYDLRDNIKQLNKRERSKAFLVFIFYFSVIFSYYLIKPSKDSLFIHYVGAKHLSEAYIIIPIATFLFIFLYDYLVRKLERRLFGSLMMGFYILNVIGIWLMFAMGLKREAAYFLYVWSDIFSVSSVTLFWSITNDIYTSEVARKVYGFLGMGSVLGGCLGSIVTRGIVTKMDTENLILASSLFFVIIILLINRIDSIARQEASDRAHSGEKPQAKPEGRGISEIYRNFQLVMRSRYLFFFTLLVFLTITCSKLVDYQIGRVLEASIADKNAKTEFMGQLYFWANLISFVVLLFSTLFYRHLGIFGTLNIAPVINLITVTGFALIPTLTCITVTKILDGSIKYGITQVTREMLYIPTSKEAKYRAKAVIDILFYRMASVFSALLQIAFTSYIILNIQQFNIIIVAVLAATLWVLWKLKGAFINGLEEKIDRIFQENAAQLPPCEQDGEICKTFNENELLLAMTQRITEGTASGGGNVNAIEAVQDLLPSLAAAGSCVYKNISINKALLILSKLHRDPVNYSLCVTYLTIALPSKPRKYYAVLLSQDIPVKRAGELQKSLE